ncbi:hypothetical protein [Deinococcus aluminii]|uniref:Uncharacterized protein n=1 Tax=Deinococcus aluminii TaxID=1656885 RepID=A0ABP9XES5_9DEIO
MTSPDTWLIALASTTDVLALDQVLACTSWQAAAHRAEQELLERLAADLDDIGTLQEATEQALLQFAELRPECGFAVQISAPCGNATWDWYLRVSRREALPAAPGEARRLTTLLGAAEHAEAALKLHDLPPLPEEPLHHLLVRDLAAERLRQQVERLAGESVLDAVDFQRELNRALQTAGEHNDGDVARFEIRVASGGDEGFTRLHVLPICDWNEADEDTLGTCGQDFVVSREDALRLHLRYLRWLAEKNVPWKEAPRRARTSLAWASA